MVICLRVLAVDLVASCFFAELFFPLGALWRSSVVSPARHLAVQASLRMKYRCFSASACSEQGLQTGTAVLLSPSV